MPSFTLENGWTLVTESRPAMPGYAVLCHDGRAYGPSDHEGGPAHRVAAWAYVLLRTCPTDQIASELAAAQAFLKQWPEGPQLNTPEITVRSAHAAPRQETQSR